MTASLKYTLATLMGSKDPVDLIGRKDSADLMGPKNLADLMSPKDPADLMGPKDLADLIGPKAPIDSARRPDKPEIGPSCSSRSKAPFKSPFKSHGSKPLTQSHECSNMIAMGKSPLQENSHEDLSDRFTQKETELCTIHPDETLCRV